MTVDNGGKGFQEQTIKDKWRKPRRVVEAREGGVFGWGSGSGGG